MQNILKKYWFFVGIAGVVTGAFMLPGVGEWIREWKILKVGIFLAFMLTGLKLETRSLGEQFKNVRVLAASLGSSLVLFPLVTVVLVRFLFGSVPDFVIGATLIAVAPVTVASGTVMTGIALGNVPLSLFICILGNSLAILTIPFSLGFLLGTTQGIDLPVLHMLINLVLTVLFPTLIGQWLRLNQTIRNQVVVYKKQCSIFSQCIVLLIIFNAVSSSTEKLVGVGWGMLVCVFCFMIALHVLMLGCNYMISRGLHLDHASTAAFTIHTSQKTLTMTYVVWSGYFMTMAPMGLIPAIAYHLTQMIMDTLVAHRFRNAALRATRVKTMRVATS
jgi:sodium/bile acid cotransporter 7